MMQYCRAGLLVLLPMVAITIVGCESSSDAAGTSWSAPAAEGGDSPAETPQADGGGSAAFDFSKVSWVGPNFSRSVRDERAVLHSASINLGQNVVRLSYTPLPSDWPRQVNAPGMLCMFVERADGTWSGGKYEWLDPGQTVKSLKNINNGYNGWRTPPRGSRVATMIFSTDGRRHSNPAYSVYQ